MPLKLEMLKNNMIKYLYGAITIMTDDVLVLWRGRERVFALTKKLIQFSDKK